MFKGSITALITPFKDGAVDEKAFTRLVEWQIKEGTDGLVPCGTTGESPTLSHEEHDRVIELCVKAAKGRVPVIAGTGSNSTDEAVQLTRHAAKAGADAALIVSPYYNKPTQEGIYRHFKAINDAVKIPLIIYNIPGRSVVDIKDETIARIAELKNVKGIKEATGDLSRLSNLRQLIGKDFCYLSGDDPSALGFNAQGGVGAISVTSNIAPKLCAKMQELSLKGDFAKALAIHDSLMPLHKAMFVETSPIPVKYAAKLLGLASGELRLPLVESSDATRKSVKQAMLGLKLIEK